MDSGGPTNFRLITVTAMSTAAGLGLVGVATSMFLRRRSVVIAAAAAAGSGSGVTETAASMRAITCTSSHAAPAGTPFVRPPRKTKAGAVRPPTDDVFDGLNDIEQALPGPIQEAHNAALEKKESMYTDPSSGLMVFSKYAHLSRGKCCGSRCRHCPYNHVNVPVDKRPKNLSLTKSCGPSEATSEPEETASGSSSSSSFEINNSHKASVYTKTGDNGTSSLFTGARASKGDCVFETLGAVDELSSFLGLAKEATKVQLALTAAGEQDQGWVIVKAFEVTQQRLLDVGSIIATPDPSAVVLKTYDPPTWTREVEELIDTIDRNLPPLGGFIIPGGSVAAGHIHVCRSVCRRAERSMVRLVEVTKKNAEDLPKTDAKGSAKASSYGVHMRASMKYVNRLSDLFFICARYVSIEADCHRKTNN